MYLNITHIEISHTEGNYGMQISAASLSLNFYSGKSYFLAICANFPCKIEEFELEVVGVGILGTEFGLAAINMSYRKITVKRVYNTYLFFIFNKFGNLFYFSQQQDILTEKFRLGILHACVCKNIYIKENLD